MQQKIRLLFLFLFIHWFSNATEVLIVADEVPAMETLAKSLKTLENIDSKIVAQTEMPSDLSVYKAVLVYIHKDLAVSAENAMINYTRAGGKLILLHHSISSFKNKNADWFPFIGVALPKLPVNEGGYAYVGGIDMELVNLAPSHFITTHKIKYPKKILYKSETSVKEKAMDGYGLINTEAYINHQLIGNKTILMGLKFKDKDGKTWMQDRAAWCMDVGKGWIFYLQPGHTVTDYENPVTGRIIANAVIYKF